MVSRLLNEHFWSLPRNSTHPTNVWHGQPQHKDIDSSGVELENNRAPCAMVSTMPAYMSTKQPMYFKMKHPERRSNWWPRSVAKPSSPQNYKVCFMTPNIPAVAFHASRARCPAQIPARHRVHWEWTPVGTLLAKSTWEKREVISGDNVVRGCWY